MFENNPIQRSRRLQLETTLFLQRRDSKSEFSFPFSLQFRLNQPALLIIKIFPSPKQKISPLNFLKDKEKGGSVYFLQDMMSAFQGRKEMHTSFSTDYLKWNSPAATETSRKEIWMILAAGWIWRDRRSGLVGFFLKWGMLKGQLLSSLCSARRKELGLSVSVEVELVENRDPLVSPLYT